MWMGGGLVPVLRAGCDPSASRIPIESCCDEDRHKAPTRPLIHPLSLQDEGTDGVQTGSDIAGDSPMRSANIIRTEGRRNLETALFGC